MIKRPELLSPAGNLEKLKSAVLYGADAVYLAGKRFGMRAAADNFTGAADLRGQLLQEIVSGKGIGNAVIAAVRAIPKWVRYTKTLLRAS